MSVRHAAVNEAERLWMIRHEVMRIDKLEV
ncbi:hypothetical protein PEC730217_11650 [Pectobacterium carotovorum subsp. carotovorum]|nr:hypothetical protein [Pectobacterium carotovorum subsp. carotovorum]PVY75069.1 hypothetical protein C7330_4397 [Pectobacterium versatile]RUR94473.1 hypothetical protein PB16LOC_00768 [Pectobacterium versatile]GKV80386.1 hypothetical protein PEC106664_11600 [Pectobacterium carotovorum subsp. carotovorum]GKW32385.1 hypothetical protein PEC730217_11650 [Pectobacterium carotovorum subsp. carotovorum]